MRWLVAGAFLVGFWTLDQTFAVVALIALGIAVGAIAAQGARPEPRPKKPKTHRWTPAFGLAVTMFGLFPFLTITRRRR